MTAASLVRSVPSSIFPPPFPRPELMYLPTELHVQIARYLPYPDALSLKHTNRHFYTFVDTGVRTKFPWLLHRKKLDLECPNEKCVLKSDETFCRGRVRKLMEKRRWHQECRYGDKGCLVVEGMDCSGKAVRRRGRLEELQGMVVEFGKCVGALYLRWRAVELTLFLSVLMLGLLWGIGGLIGGCAGSRRWLPAR